MTFEEAIKESIIKYYEGHSFDSYKEATGKDIKYTKDYFDSVEEEMLPKEKTSDVKEPMETEMGIE